MSLTLVSVPIGNPEDITLRALNSLKEAELYIGEERKPMFRLLKELGVATPKVFELLNEHSTSEEIMQLAKKCQETKTILMTDCGTPGFSDPGSELVKHCRQLNIPVTANPGASALTTFISLCGVHLTTFHFEGFLPRETEARERRLKEIANFKLPIVLMDTPYRLKKILEESKKYLSNKKFVLGMDFTKENEQVLTGSIQSICKSYDGQKHEFMLLVY